MVVVLVYQFRSDRIFVYISVFRVIVEVDLLDLVLLFVKIEIRYLVLYWREEMMQELKVVLQFSFEESFKVITVQLKVFFVGVYEIDVFRVLLLKEI